MQKNVLIKFPYQTINPKVEQIPTGIKFEDAQYT